jgi:Ca2+/Na+ antiporter
MMASALWEIRIMREDDSRDQRYEQFERLLIGGLAVFAAVAIVELAGSANLIGPLLLALCCLSVSLPFLIFQIACLTLGVTQRHRVLLQTATVVVALVGVFGLLISVSAAVGTLFTVSCICAYYLFVVFSGESEMSENKDQADDSSGDNDAETATDTP